MSKGSKSIKLTYFDGRGRCEAIRLILAYGGIAYEDKRITFADWPALKPTTPYGSLPVMDVDGTQLGQSIAISRYAARLAGIVADSPMEQAIEDSIVDACTDMREAFFKMAFAKEEEKGELKKKLEESVPVTLASLEKILGKDKFFGGKKISWADVHLFSIYETLKDMMDAEFQKQKGIAAIVKAVGDSPKIKEYVSKRPKTEF